MLSLRGLSKSYTMGDSVVRALDEVDLFISSNDYVAIMGPSGSGKSTLMNILGCLTGADSGSYQLEGKEVAELDDDQLAMIRNRHIGFVFQSFNLQARRTALENVMLPLRFSEVSRDEAKTRATVLLQKVGLGDRMAHRPSEMSGGQRQRVAIARALVNNPSVVLADEPTGNLDSKTSRDIMKLFDELHGSGQTIIVVTHEEDIAQHAQRIVILRDGKIGEIKEKHCEALADVTA